VIYRVLKFDAILVTNKFDRNLYFWKKEKNIVVLMIVLWYLNLVVTEYYKHMLKLYFSLLDSPTKVNKSAKNQVISFLHRS
jgi:hypothetical protein